MPIILLAELVITLNVKYRLFITNYWLLFVVNRKTYYLKTAY